MPADTHFHTRRRLALAPAAFLAAALAVTAGAQQPEPKKSADPAQPKSDTKGKEKEPRVIKLPDGTYLWLGTPADGSDERVTLTPEELQKLIDQAEQLKKQLAAKKPTPPSGCAIRGKVEKRGEQLVAVLKFTFTFHTTAAQTAVALGGKRGFLVAATLDGNKLPVLETTEDGYAVLVEKTGDHTLTLDLEAPVASRGAKPELGFEVGLPRSPITTLLFDPPDPDVKRVNLTTRTPDPGKVAPPEPRRTSALPVSHLAPRPGHENGYALGPIDSLEVTWDPPAAAAQPADQLRSAEIDVTVQLTEGVVEATAKVKFRGTARDWKLLAPANADVTLDRAPGAPELGGPALPPVITKISEQNRTVWKIELPLGSSAGDWVVTAVTRQPRPKSDDAKHRGPFAVGPFAVPDVLRQTGTVVVRAAPHTRLSFKHGPDLRKAEPPAKVDPVGLMEEEGTVAFFRLLTGPTGANPAGAPLFSFEASPQSGDVAVRPTYRLTLTDAGWRVRAEVKVFPIRTEVGEITVEVPAEWRGLEASPPELVEGVQPGAAADGFWAVSAARLTGNLRVPVVVRLAAAHKQPFDLVLTASVPVEPGVALAAIPMPRFPGAFEKEASVTAAVPEGLEVRGELREWDGEFALWGAALAPPPGPDGKPPRVATTVGARAEAGIARVLLAWNPHRPDLVTDVRAEVVLGERQLEVVQRMTLRSAEGFPRQLRFRGPSAAANLRSQPALAASGGDWFLNVAPDAKEITLTVTFAVPLPSRPTDAATWQVPVALLWPAGSGRAEAMVRVWSSAAVGRAITTSSAGWRELVAEPSPGRDSLPALSVAASGGELPLTLEVREVGNSGAVAVWVERGLVQAWAGGESATEYRARFLLRRWLAPSVEIRLPGPLAGPTPEFRIDGVKANAIPLSESGAYRVPLPAPGRPVAVEVRYQLPTAAGRTGEAVYQPPQLPAAAFAGPLRWQVTLPNGAVPLLTGGGRAEFRWQLGVTGVAPAPLATADGLEQWFRSGEEPTGGDVAGTSVLTARQVSAGPVSVYRVSRNGLLIACSVSVFLLVLALSRLSRRALGPVVAVIGCAAGVAAVMLPHPAAVIAGASQPGLAAGCLVLVALALARLAYRRRVAHLPGFSRTAPEPDADVLPIPSSARKRPSVAGSSGGASATPAGG